MIKNSVEIPFSQIAKIQVYNNPVIGGKRKSMLQIQQETGADYIINGTLYNMRTGMAVCPLKDNNVCYCSTTDKYWGYAWDRYDPASFHMQIVPDESRPSYIACSCLVKDWVCVEKPIFNSAQGGKRGRTAIGTSIKNHEFCLSLYVSSDAHSTGKLTPYSLASELQALGWRDGVMLDCGGSSQGYFNGEKITSARRCAHYICIYLKKEKKE